MKTTFLGHNKPLLTNMIIEMTPAESIATIRNAIYDGADAFGFHLCRFPKQYQNVGTLKNIFNYAEDRPILVMNYRRHLNEGIPDEELVEGHMMALEAGATMCDIMADMYDPSPLEITYNEKAIDKQKRLIEEIHKKGGEVLMSSHTWQFYTAEQAVEHAKAVESRGTDMIKIAMRADTEDELLEVIKTTILLKREVKIPCLYVCMGQYGKAHRVLVPVFGSPMVLCVQKYDELSHKEQPLLRSTKAVLDNLDWKLSRDVSTIYTYN